MRLQPVAFASDVFIGFLSEFVNRPRRTFFRKNAKGLIIQHIIGAIVRGSCTMVVCSDKSRCMWRGPRHQDLGSILSPDAFQSRVLGPRSWHPDPPRDATELWSLDLETRCESPYILKTGSRGLSREPGLGGPFAGFLYEVRTCSRWGGAFTDCIQYMANTCRKLAKMAKVLAYF